MIIFFLVILSFFNSNAFPKYTYEFVYPDSNDIDSIQVFPNKILLGFSDNKKYSVVNYYFNQSTILLDEQFSLSNEFELKFANSLTIDIPKNALFFKFYLKDRNGDFEQPELDKSFIIIKDQSGYPRRGGYLSLALNYFESDPDFYLIPDWIIKEIEYYPDNFEAFYFYWRYKGYIGNPDSQTGIYQKLDEMQNDYSSNANFWILKAKVLYSFDDFDQSVFCYQKAIELTDDNNVIAQVLQHMLSEFDLFEYLEKQMKDTYQDSIPGSAKKLYRLFLNIIREHNQNTYKDFIELGWSSDAESIKQIAAFHKILYAYEQNELEIFSQWAYLSALKKPNHLYFSELSQLVSILSLFPQFKSDLAYIAEYSYEKWNSLTKYQIYDDDHWQLLGISILENYAWSCYLNDKLGCAAEHFEKLIQQYPIHDDLIFYRLGLIYYAIGRYDLAIDYLGKSYLLNFNLDIYELFIKLYEEFYQTTDNLNLYIERLKQQVYRVFDLNPLVGFSDYYLDYRPTLLVVFRPFTSIYESDFEYLSELKRTNPHINLIVFYPVDEKIDFQSFFDRYHLPAIGVTESTLHLLSPDFSNSYLLLFDRDNFLINRVSFFRPDWDDILQSFLKISF